eukprot:m51a1_g3759 putative serine acetyltransferase (334) ;mRNA; f:108876-110407
MTMPEADLVHSCEHVLKEAADALLESYAQDSPMFLRSESIAFPPRHCFDEAALLSQIFFPRYFNCPQIAHPVNKGLLVEKLGELSTFFYKGVRPYVTERDSVCASIRTVMSKFAVIRERLKKDVHAAYVGDPACNSYVEIIRCYPGMLAIMVQRVAHELFLVGAKVYARELTELVHRYTGTDIHPGATIGDFFFIDHATGTVIGETAELGDWCRLYQNVTIGALHFQQDSTGVLKKGYKRHPTIGSNCVIGSGAKVLGNIKIGSHVSIGANSWVQEDIPDCTAVFIHEHPQQVRKQKMPAVSPPPEYDLTTMMQDPLVAGGRLTPSGVAPPAK